MNDLAATDVDTGNLNPGVTANLNLGVAGASDAANDAITVNGTVGVDLFGIAGSGGSASVTSTSLAVLITNAAPANDTLTINA